MGPLSGLGRWRSSADSLPALGTMWLAFLNRSLTNRADISGWQELPARPVCSFRRMESGSGTLVRPSHIGLTLPISPFNQQALFQK